jgi:thiol-disulfide isomerase/thioredoxin
MKTIFALLVLGFSAVQLKAQTTPAFTIKQVDSVIKNTTKPLIINFWATYCGPCIEEFPAFEKAAKTYAKDSVQFLMVSLDINDAYPAGIEKFYKKKKFTLPKVWLNETDPNYFMPIISDKWAGNIPVTLFVNPTTGYRFFHDEMLTAKELKLQIEAMLKP